MQVDSRPIQGGTVSTSHGSPLGTSSPGTADTPVTSSTSSISQPTTPHSFFQTALYNAEDAMQNTHTPENPKKSRHAEGGYQRHYNGSIITTMASGHTVSSNTITSVLAGRANTATVSVNTPSLATNPPLPNKQQSGVAVSTVANQVPVTTASVSKSPLEMVQSVVSSIQIPQVSNACSLPQQQHQHQQQQHQQHSNMQVGSIEVVSIKVL